MSHIPDAEVSLIEPWRRGGVYTWRVLCCPYCGKQHTHGAGTDRQEVASFLGGRVAHCDTGPGTIGQYNLVWREGVTG